MQAPIPRAQLVDRILKYRGNVLVTGRAGTGKSTLLREITKKLSMNFVVLAPTGIAALNVEGSTFHSFFQIHPGPVSSPEEMPENLKDTLRAIRVIIIDEMSMVRADLLDSVDKRLRIARNSKRPFGGVRVIAFGDPHQLPPVVTTTDRKVLFQMGYKKHFFFNSLAFNDGNFDIYELTRVYRQQDKVLLDILNQIRENKITTESMNQIRSRISQDPGEGATHLCPRRAEASFYNHQELKKITSSPEIFTGKLEGLFNPKELPSPKILTLKIGARVMVTKNSSKLVNGSIGRVLKFVYTNPVKPMIQIIQEDGSIHTIYKEIWTRFRFWYDREKDIVRKKPIGTFEQFPLKLAYGLTIHKSQGLTLNSMYLDLGAGIWEPGHLYVAMSRCRRLEDIHLARVPVPTEIRVDPAIVSFFSSSKVIAVV